MKHEIPPHRAENRLLPAFHENRGTLLAMAVAAGGLWVFLLVAGRVQAGSTGAFDTAFMLLLRDPLQPADPLGPPWLEEVMRDLTALGGTAVLTMVTLAAIGFLAIARRPRAALAVGIAIATGIVLSTLLKLGYDRPRPELVPYGARVYTASFPSGHSMMSAVVYLTLAALLARVLTRRRLRVYVIGLGIAVTLLVGVSRVYLGVHWPTDVLGGWTLGAAFALLASHAMLRLQILRAVERRPIVNRSALPRRGSSKS